MGDCLLGRFAHGVEFGGQYTYCGVAYCVRANKYTVPRNDSEDQEAIIRLIDAMIAKQQMESALLSLDDKTLNA